MTRRQSPLLLLLLAVATSAAQQRPPEVRIPAVRDSMLVSTEWLTRHLRDPDVVILHISHERADFDKGHIPGARFIGFAELAVTRDGLQNELPPAADLKQLFERAGVSDSSRVVLYGDRSGLSAARAFFTLDYLGHGDRAALLDGGFEKWRDEKRPISTESASTAPGKFTPVIHPELLVTLPAVRDLSFALQNDPRAPVALLDARPAADFAGTQASEGVPRAGHIPGAASLYWAETTMGKDDPELLAPSELRRAFAKAGVAPGQKVVTYCRTGVQAAFLYFVARYLGYDTALYDGSLAEWSTAPSTQVVSGPK